MNLWDENIAEIPPNMDPIPPHTQHPTPAFTHLRDAAHHTSFQTYFFLTPWTFYEDIDMIPVNWIIVLSHTQAAPGAGTGIETPRLRLPSQSDADS